MMTSHYHISYIKFGNSQILSSGITKIKKVSITESCDVTHFRFNGFVNLLYIDKYGSITNIYYQKLTFFTRIIGDLPYYTMYIYTNIELRLTNWN